MEPRHGQALDKRVTRTNPPALADLPPRPRASDFGAPGFAGALVDAAAVARELRRATTPTAPAASGHRSPLALR
jgi:hypothetical protein